MRLLVGGSEKVVAGRFGLPLAPGRVAAALARMAYRKACGAARRAIALAELRPMARKMDLPTMSEDSPIVFALLVASAAAQSVNVALAAVTPLAVSTALAGSAQSDLVPVGPLARTGASSATIAPVGGHGYAPSSEDRWTRSACRERRSRTQRLRHWRPPSRPSDTFSPWPRARPVRAAHALRDRPPNARGRRRRVFVRAL